MIELLIALLSGSAGWYLSHLAMLASEDAAVLSGYIEDVEACSDAVEEYWLADPGSKNDDLILAARVRARFASLGVFYGEARNHLRERRLQQYHVLQVRFFKEGTGGEFESHQRNIDPERAIESYKISREVVQVLRLARRERLSPIHGIGRLWASARGRSS